jgi:hypothetical protein
MACCRQYVCSSRGISDVSHPLPENEGIKLIDVFFNDTLSFIGQF